ncbi:MAG TPA: NosD domain-containing protein [Devosiaceae bacterium]|jgi:hypothetical protein
MRSTLRQAARNRAFRQALAFIFGLGLLALPSIALAATLYVSPDGPKDGTGTKAAPFAAIQDALRAAQPGDTIDLLPGIYFDDFVTVRDGTPDKPITIRGEKGAIVKGAGQPRVAQISHDYIQLQDFVLDGHWKDGITEDAYRDKLLYVIGIEPGNGVTGLKITGMTLTNAGGECIRLKYQAQKNEISGNNISLCGRHDFQFGGGKNGEGIYIGTAPEQLGQFGAPDAAVDHSSDNWIHDNVFDTQGNECVDIKEASSGNIVEHNRCTGQSDPESGGFDSRGSGNIFRFNTVTNNKGTGIRLGGDGESDGISNDVYGNTFSGNAQGVMRVLRAPQGKICENIDSQNGAREPNDLMKQIEVTASCTAQVATAEGRAQLALTRGDGEDADDEDSDNGGDDEDDQPLPLKCSSQQVYCVLGTLLGDARNRIKILQSSEDSLVDHQLVLSQLVQDSAVDLKSLAGKTVLVEFSGLQDKELIGARIVQVMGNGG